MKILHTSDWHFGRRFERESLLDMQQAFADWMVDTVREEAIDLVVIAGDVYDRAVPADDAVELLDRTLAGIRQAGAVIVLIPGNHDSSSRVGFGEPALGAGGIHVRGSLDRAGEPLFLPFDDGDLAVVPVPYLDPLRYFRRSAVPTSDDEGAAEPQEESSEQDAEPLRSHEAALREALAPAGDAIRKRRVGRSLVVAHAFVAGSVVWSESEKVLPGGKPDRVGGADRVDLRLFEGFSYTALGHLHSPQEFEQGRVAYSGSPLPYSFSETRPKSVRIVEMDPKGRISSEVRPIPIGRGVATLRGTLEEILENPAHESVRNHWIRAQLTDTEVRHNPMGRLRQRFPHAVALEYVTLDGGRGTGLPSLQEVQSFSPALVARRYWEDVRDSEPTPVQARLLEEAIEAARNEIEVGE